MPSTADMVFAVLPLVVLIYLMTKKNSVPSYRALPLCMVLIYVIKLIYFKVDPNLLNATVVKGLLMSLTPILIVGGAILLFKTMEQCGSLRTINEWLQMITANRVGQLMIVGWAFGFFIEGASGFGTPAALAAPILVALGVTPLRAAIFCLIMNSVPVSFGAVGTPTWFGLGGLGLSEQEILRIGINTAIFHSIASLIIPVIGLAFVVSWKDIRRNLLFVYLSIFGCVIPYLICARFNYEFPSIIGGLVGLVLSVLLARKGIGLAPEAGDAGVRIAIGLSRIMKAMFPLVATVLVLLITRVGQLGVKGILTASDPHAEIDWGSLGQLTVSPTLVVGLDHIFHTEVSWSHQVLYVPSIIPFLVVSTLTFVWFRMTRKDINVVFSETFAGMRKPVLALLGALVFVCIMMLSENHCPSSTMIIGTALAEGFGGYWKGFASYLGGLGAFFSGSNTVSNLTFGDIQYSIARKLNLNHELILAEQSAGGAMGNMVCIHNIVAVCSVLGINNMEGYILKRTIWPMLIYGMIVGVVAVTLF